MCRYRIMKHLQKIIHSDNIHKISNTNRKIFDEFLSIEKCSKLDSIRMKNFQYFIFLSRILGNILKTIDDNFIKVLNL